MESVFTLTANPAVDVCTTAAEIVPTRKIRCTAARRDPGGGGINVARVVRRLGGDVTAIYTAGGSTGNLLRKLLEDEKIRNVAIAVAEETREDFTVLEQKSGEQYRFVLPGTPLSTSEWGACLEALSNSNPWPRYLVASGSLPPDVPDDFYARAARLAKAHAAKMIVDTSGAALESALKEGVYLIKPNLRELQELTGCSLVDQAQQIRASRSLIEAGGTEIVALTLGAQGALLVTRDMVQLCPAPEVQPLSAVGAGDSFTGGTVWSLAAGHSIIDALRYGVAAGSAAVLNSGTELCHQADVMRLYQRMELVPVCCQQ
jgi:6-phosphofructokinase 2